jgi:signal transduction histidine kinase
LHAAACNRAEERGLQVKFWLGPAIPQVIADRRILQLGILQYIENAIEHAPPDTAVAVRLFHVGNDLHIEVTDQGPGIPMEVQSRLFERFVPISLTDGPVTGVGLAIVKAAADAHGGSVYVQSSADTGSTFGLIIPLAPIAS